MAECTTLSDFSRGCGNNVGSIKAIKFGFQSDITSITKNSTTGIITAMAVSTAPKNFEVRKNQAGFTDGSAINLENESSLFPVTLGINARRRDGGKSNTLRKMAEGQPYLYFLVQDGNSKWWLLENMQLSQIGGGSGMTRADGSNYDLNFVNEEEDLAWEIDATVVAGLI